MDHWIPRITHDSLDYMECAPPPRPPHAWFVWLEGERVHSAFMRNEIKRGGRGGILLRYKDTHNLYRVYRRIDDENRRKLMSYIMYTET